MKLEFLGTRGETKVRSRKHFMHSSMLLSYRGARIMIDCGYDWLGIAERQASGFPAPGLILITHAHPDHAWGLKQGSPCPVYASAETWAIIGGYPIKERHRRIAAAYQPVTYRGITFELFPAIHSLRAPANGYRISAGRATIFYVPDVVYINERQRALRRCDIYIGDGATLVRSFVRRRGDLLFGHAPVQTQLTWCRKEGVPRAIITHCGTEIVGSDESLASALVNEKLAAMATERGVDAQIAYDGLRVYL